MSHKYLTFLKHKNDITSKQYEFMIPDNKDFVFSPSFNSINVTRFYQICAFKNEFSNKYHIRRFIINNNNEYVDINELQLNDRQYKKLLLLPSQLLKLYSTSDIKFIDYPTFDDILVMQSKVLCNNLYNSNINSFYFI